MLCNQCGQAVPEGAAACPNCTGNGREGRPDAMRAGLAGGLKGLFLGLLPVIVLLMEYGGEPGVKLLAFAVPAVLAATGFVLAYLKVGRKC